jgi:hypothetical protein
VVPLAVGVPITGEVAVGVVAAGVVAAVLEQPAEISTSEMVATRPIRIMSNLEKWALLNMASVSFIIYFEIFLDSAGLLFHENGGSGLSSIITPHFVHHLLELIALDDVEQRSK